MLKPVSFLPVVLSSAAVSGLGTSLDAHFGIGNCNSQGLESGDSENVQNYLSLYSYHLSLYSFQLSLYSYQLSLYGYHSMVISCHSMVISCHATN